ncbi:tryptophan synthase subunit beta like protein [Nitrincola alkalilacustris]|uniref:tryptophan synthase subunit beta like protein n=1 Tax=Nitrincola alkalilacustris TaxID=1571224 RepID=UPI00124C8B6A|nr:tryptophan synthase subunit beta like protein [Nitrincola alkalilacustris]
MYIRRDSTGAIIAVSSVQAIDFTEEIASDSPELVLFLNQYSQAIPEQQALIKSDTELVRVVEDLIELLTDKGVIQFTDLPSAAQKKLMTRQSLRSKVNGLKLFSDDNDDELTPL